MHRPFGRDEDHVEWNERVLHPHRRRLRRIVDEQHTRILWKRAAKHQSERALLIGGRHLDVEVVIPCRGLEHERSRASGHAAVPRHEKPKHNQTGSGHAAEPFENVDRQ
jgi:hypothetical protein